MYNRYIRNQQGVFTCAEQEDAEAGRAAFCGPPPPAAEKGGAEEEGTFLQRMLQKLGVGEPDTGDLLLLLILFLLFSENGGKDDELPLALGLLLIL